MHDEAAAIEELKGLSENAKMHLSHYTRHVLCLAHLVAYKHDNMSLASMVWDMKKKIEEAGL